MPFTGQNARLDRPDLKPNDHNQIWPNMADHLEGRDAFGVVYPEKGAQFAALLVAEGWTGWRKEAFSHDGDVEDLFYMQEHASVTQAGISIIKAVQKKLFALELIGIDRPSGSPPAPTPTPGPAPAPVGRYGAFDELEVAIAEMGLGASAANAITILEELDAAWRAAVKKINGKLSDGSAWQAAVNCQRAADLFGVQSRFIGHDFRTTDFQEHEWRAFLGEQPADTSGEPGFSIGGKQS